MPLDRDLYNEFFRLDREGVKPMNEQEQKDHRDNAKAIFNNPTFQNIFKQYHALEFSRMVEAIGRSDSLEALKHKSAIDTLSTIYEHFSAMSDGEDSDSLFNDDAQYV